MITATAAGAWAPGDTSCQGFAIGRPRDKGWCTKGSISVENDGLVNKKTCLVHVDRAGVISVRNARGFGELHRRECDRNARSYAGDNYSDEVMMKPPFLLRYFNDTTMSRIPQDRSIR
jgi:hypothetical protein